MRFFEINTRMDTKTFKSMFVAKKTKDRDECEIDQEESRLEENFEREVIAKADQFWKKYEENAFTFQVRRQRASLILGVVLIGDVRQLGLEVTDAAGAAEILALEFLGALGITNLKLKIVEITLKNLRSMINGAYRNDYLRDDDKTYELLGLERVIGNRNNGLVFDEYLDTDFREGGYPKENLLKKAREIFCETSLCSELERIYQGARYHVTKGHPVHYVVRCDSSKQRMTIVSTLFDALRTNGRIQNGRISIIKMKQGEEGGSEADYDSFFRANSGGLVVIDHIKKTHGEDNDLARPGMGDISGLCEAARRYKNEVLTVICLPHSADALQELFLEQLDGLTFIPIREEALCGAAAKRYLSAAAKKANITPDSSLYAVLKNDKGFLTADLDREFDRWFTKILKDQVFPQYGKLSSEAYLSMKQKPKGSAYSVLDAMIGLHEAKSVIRKAVNYYKAQKMFRDRGMASDDIAMHMIFTGNPGSAKTTVARLFAQIMKENGLLSRGDLIEVGRGDLVGKYVGWTAQTVKQKFLRAQGSVLFIDEAYSLVDDRSGSYGDEAINTIVQEMENNRGDMAVIFAGYPEKMERFLETNPGLRSRIAFHVPFADYSPDELYDILEFMASEKEISIAPCVRAKVMPVFKDAVRSNDFGNGRFVRNIFEIARMNQADRLVNSNTSEITEEDVKTLFADDFEGISAPKTPIVTIGFAA